MNSFDKKPRPFLTRPLIIDWLQWGEFPEKLGEIDYPQATLSLIKEYKDKYDALAKENEELKLQIARCQDIIESDGKDYSDLLASYKRLESAGCECPHCDRHRGLD